MTTTSATPSTGTLHKKITMRYAVALYISSVLGSGILVLPGLAAELAGPASLLAWLGLSLVSYPFAYTFASLSARRPKSGGIYVFAKESFGPRVANVVGWFFAAWFITGAPAVTLIAASYISYAFPVSREAAYSLAALIIIFAAMINYEGIVISGKVQLGVVAAIVALLLATVLASTRLVEQGNFFPLFPNGFLPIGVAAALIIWSYFGYENVPNVAEEFENPERDFPRSITLSVLLISGLYLSVAFVTVGTRAYQAGGSVAPFAAILSNVLGPYAAMGTAVLAVLIIFGTVNAYMAGISRVVYAVAREGGLPKILDKIHPRTGVPNRCLIALLVLSQLTLILFFVLNVSLQSALLIPSGAAISVYVIGSASGIKLLKEKGMKRLFPWISFAVSIMILPFVGVWLTVSLAVAVLSLAYGQFIGKENRGKDYSREPPK
ncbi:MAG: amino acid permease [Thaumarchaeota archaeon]|nr:amino acid permease [Nitrososphaerota archaeon]